MKAFTEASVMTERVARGRESTSPSRVRQRESATYACPWAKESLMSSTAWSKVRP